MAILHCLEKERGEEWRVFHAEWEDIRKEMAVWLNLERGVMLLGVEDDDRIAALTSSLVDAPMRVPNVARQNLQPAIIHVCTSMAMENGKINSVLEFPADNPGNPYKARRGNAWVTYIRVGRRSREATHDEKGQLYQAARRARYEIKPFPNTEINGVAAEKMKEGVVRVACNKLLKEILRGYGYIEHFGMGVPGPMIQSMWKLNGNEPDLVEEDRFIVPLRKEASS
ncbi:hypothetical protein [Desulfosoma caldarium]|uniref:Uncharacterized protein n=1 Tax=Desulfosoma caldarium TaxID=610254 RepID=A0A3N1UT97_9BACT|nr:hypothetical protein [Desulfosoma caldarium]ROQ91071.1 hypothetical protein EDC27_2348 [Desulfosoma caldarium]